MSSTDLRSQIGLGADGDYPVIDNAAAALADAFVEGAKPSCTADTLVQQFQVAWNSYAAANDPSNVTRVDGIYDTKTQTALNAALQTSTTGEYAGGSSLANLPKAPDPALCASTLTSSGSSSLTSKLTTGYTPYVIGAAAIILIGGTMYYTSKSHNRRRR